MNKNRYICRMNTVKEIREGIVRSLTPHVGKDEAEAMARIILEDAAGVSRTAAIIDPGRLLEDATVARISAIVGRVADGEPLQYVLGEAVFMGMRLRVTPYTLIPRPETAGLVDIITDEYSGSKDLQIIDIGTGSGCIAIALARALPYCAVTAADISSEALAVASYNASALGTSNVKCIRLDALHLPMPAAPLYDIIVSNPPYVTVAEKADMDRRVLDYEPGTALFVPDDDPLRFYRAIAVYAQSALRPGGSLYFEINPLYATDMEQMLRSLAFEDVDIRRDYRGKKRYAVCLCPEK